MELEVLSVQGAKVDQVVSIRAGSQRKQAAVSSLGQGTPFRISGTGGLNPFRIDILQQVGSTRLALKPGEGTYSVDLKGGENGNVKVAFAVRKKGSNHVPPKTQAIVTEDMKEEDRRFASQAAQAKEYLESHELLPFVRALLQTVIRDRPNDPYNFIADQFRMAATACKPCQPADQSNDATTFTEPLLKNVIPFHADPPVPPATKGDHKLPIFAQRVQPEEEPAETSERDVEALRKQVREALGEAVEDGTLEELMAEAASQPFAAKAELLVVKRKTPPTLPKAKRTPQEAWHGTTALEAKSEDPLTGEARLAKMRVSVDENMAEEEAATGPPLDAISVASSQEDDLKLAKAHVNGPSTIAATPADVVVADVEEQAADEAHVNGPSTIAATPADVVVADVEEQAADEEAHVNGPSTIAATPADVVVADVEEQAADKEAHVNGPSTIATTPADVVVADVEEQPPHHHEVTNEVLPEQLEKLRQKAQEALLQGAQSGELWTLLQGHASQRAAQSELLKASQSGRLHCALKQLRRVEDVEQIRQHAVDSLVTAARSGRLLQTLQLTMKCSALQEIRKESREMVTVAAETGLLQEALQDAQVAPEGDLETLRHLTKEAMMMAAESGELAHVLESATGKAPSKPILRKQDTPESSIVDLSEASDSIDQRLSIHTAMAVQMVQDEVKLAADKEAVRQSNNDIKAKIAELQQQYQKLLQEHDELQKKMQSKSEND